MIIRGGVKSTYEHLRAIGNNSHGFGQLAADLPLSIHLLKVSKRFFSEWKKISVTLLSSQGKNRFSATE